MTSRNCSIDSTIYLNVKPIDPNTKVIFTFHILLPCVEFLPFINVFTTSNTPKSENKIFDALIIYIRFTNHQKNMHESSVIKTTSTFIKKLNKS
jgi:hypothetical protein